MKKEFKFIDLFSGCGGFSEGFYQEGFKSVLHLDFDAPCCNTIKERMSWYKYSDEEIDKSVIHGDITVPEVHDKIEEVIGTESIDVLVGGPPCQSFSSVGRAQDPDSMRNDPRNYLFKSYLEVLEKHMPKIFVFENVSGLLSAKPGGNPIFPEIIANMSKHYSVCDDKDVILLNSSHYGVPQVRKRVILIGVRNDLNISSRSVYDLIKKTHFSPDMELKGDINGYKKYRTVRSAICDLPKLKPGEGDDEIDFIPNKTNEYIKLIRSNNFYKLYNHSARKHNDLDKERYKLLSMNDWQLKDLARIRELNKILRKYL